MRSGIRICSKVEFTVSHKRTSTFTRSRFVLVQHPPNSIIMSIFFLKKKRIEKVTPQQQATRVWVNSLVLEEEGHSGFGYWYEAGEHDTWRCEGIGQAPPGPRLPGWFGHARQCPTPQHRAAILSGRWEYLSTDFLSKNLLNFCSLDMYFNICVVYFRIL